MTGARKTRSSSVASTPPPTTLSTNESTILDDLRASTHSSTHFLSLYDQCYQITALRGTLVGCLCKILADSAHVDSQIVVHILDSFVGNPDSLLVEVTDLQFKQEILPFIKRLLSTCEENDQTLRSLLRFLLVLIEHQAKLFTSTLAEWLSSILHFVVTRISSSSYLIFGDFIIDLLAKIVKCFTPLPKEIVDVLGRSPSSVISTNFLTQLKTWVKHVDDLKLALFAIHLWEPLAALLSRLLTRGHTKGNEMLAVIQDAFVVANYSIRGAAFSAWASFMSHIYRSDLNLNNDDTYQQQLYNRLLKLFLTPFLPDYTSKTYPTHVDDVLLPFLSFAFGSHTSARTPSTTIIWWPECRKIGIECLHEILADNTHSEGAIKTAGDQILSYLFDCLLDELTENTINDDKSVWLTSWHSYLTHLTRLLASNHSINDAQRTAINTALLTRIEQLWIDSRTPTGFLFRIFDAFERTAFPLAIETVRRDSSVRTKTLSATQNNQSQDKSEPPFATRTTLSDQYLHMMLEHAIRYIDAEQTYLHVLGYLIDTLSKTSDDNFCHQTGLLLLKCSFELTLQPTIIPALFWQVWLRCSNHLIPILNNTRSVEFNRQRQETAIELLLRPLAFGDSQHLDHPYTLLWTQLFKALSRLVLLDGKQLIHLYIELLRHGLVFEQAINAQENQRLFGFILTTIKCLLKTLNDVDLSSIPKRSLPSLSSITLCYTQLAVIVNAILQRLLASTEDRSTEWLLVCHCLTKSNKIATNEQSKSTVFAYVRDQVVDLFSICKTCSQLEIILTNLTQIQPFLLTYDQSIIATSTPGASPVSTNKQQQQQQLSDNVILNKIIGTIQAVFESSNGSSLLQLVFPLLIIAFEHGKAAMRNKARKCWNETFGRLTCISYPNELRANLRDLKDKEHLLLPCFLADHDNSNTAGSAVLVPTTPDESQLSQQIDIPTPFMIPASNPKPTAPASPARFSSPCLPPVGRSIAVEKPEPVFIPITNNISHDNQSDSPVIISKRMLSTSSGLTEKQKEKLRTRHAIPLLCDDNSSTQSLSYTMDTPTIENMMATYQLRNASAGSQEPTTDHSLSLLQQPSTDAASSVQSSPDNNATVESPGASFTPSPPTASESTENENSSLPTSASNTEDDFPEESSISRKLRRSRRPSTSARKSLTNNARKKRTLPSTADVNTIADAAATATAPEAVEPPSSSSPIAADVDTVKSRPLKSILKRLSPTRPRQDHSRRVAFHDQVKVLLFASPVRRDPNAPPKKKSPSRDENKYSSSISTRRSSGIHSSEQSNKMRSSKLFILPEKPGNEPTLNSNETEPPPIKPAEPIFPALADCDKPLDSLIHVVYGGVCPTNAINYFRSIKMSTVGDIARSTAAQIEVYPLPPPKLANIQKALSLYQERLVTSPSLSPIIGTNGESLTPIASTSEEPIAFSDGTFIKEAASVPTTTAINDPHHTLYDVDTLIDSLDYERLYLNDNKEPDDESTPSSTSQSDFIRTRRQLALANRDEQISPQKRRLSSANEDENNDDIENQSQDEQISPKKPSMMTITLGDRLQKAAEIFQSQGRLPFDDDYIELVRQLFHNSALTHLEQLHLKSLFLDT